MPIFNKIMSNYKERLINWLILQRNLKGLTQLQLSNLLKKNQSFVSKYENQGQKLGIIEFLEICNALSADPTKEIKGILNEIKV